MVSPTKVWHAHSARKLIPDPETSYRSISVASGLANSFSGGSFVNCWKKNPQLPLPKIQKIEKKMEDKDKHISINIILNLSWLHDKLKNVIKQSNADDQNLGVTVPRLRWVNSPTFEKNGTNMSVLLRYPGTLPKKKKHCSICFSPKNSYFLTPRKPRVNSCNFQTQRPPHVPCKTLHLRGSLFNKYLSADNWYVDSKLTKNGCNKLSWKNGVNNQYKKHLQKAGGTSEVKLEISLVFSNLANLWKNKGWGKLRSYSQLTHSIFNQRKVGVFHRSFLEFEGHFESRKFTWNPVGSLWNIQLFPHPMRQIALVSLRAVQRDISTKTAMVNYNESAKTCPSKKNATIKLKMRSFEIHFFAGLPVVEPFNTWTLIQPFRSGPKVSKPTKLHEDLHQVSFWNGLLAMVWRHRIVGGLMVCPGNTTGWKMIWHNKWVDTLQGINISHLGKRKIIFKMPFLGDMLVPWRIFLIWTCLHFFQI